MPSDNQNGGERGFRRSKKTESSRPPIKRYRTRLQTSMALTNGTQPDGAQVVETQLVSTQDNGNLLPECQPSTSTCQHSLRPKTKSSAGPKKKSGRKSSPRPNTKPGRKSSTRPKTKPGRKSRRRKRVVSESDSVSESEDEFIKKEYDEFLNQNEESEHSEPIVTDPFYNQDFDYEDDDIEEDKESSHFDSELEYMLLLERHPLPVDDDNDEEVSNESSSQTELDFDSDSNDKAGPDDDTVLSLSNNRNRPMGSLNRDQLDVSVRKWLDNVEPKFPPKQ